jgi:hypothetical protein
MLENQEATVSRCCFLFTEDIKLKCNKQANRRKRILNLNLLRRIDVYARTSYDGCEKEALMELNLSLSIARLAKE